METGQVIEALREGFGPDFRLVERVATVCAEGEQDPERVVDATGIDFSTVRSILSHDGWSSQVARSIADEIPGYVRRDDLRRWVAPDLHDPERVRLIDTVQSVVDGVPGPRQELDHIQATAGTVADRALVAARSVDLRHASVLFLGDHDLTSVAVAALEPTCSTTVVDIDEALLAYIATVSPSTRTLFCDLRLGFPPELVGGFDLVVTDPPYSVPGISLFVERARALLRPRMSSRVLIAYGYSTRALEPARLVQAAILDQALLFEAILPGFNRYSAAPAIGKAADLYVARVVPTRRSWRSVSDDVTLAVYSKGPNAVNRPESPVESSATHDPASIRIKPAGESPSPSRIDRYLYGQRPPRLVSSGQTTMTVPLDPELAELGFRLALAAPPVETIEIACSVPIPTPGPGLAEILSARWGWDTRRSGETETLRFKRRPEVASVGLGYLASHSMSTVRNAAVEAHIREAMAGGETVSKRDARALFEASPLGQYANDSVVDLPDWALSELARFVTRREG